MCVNRLIVSLTAAIFAVLALGQAAHADLLIQVDKSAQRDQGAGLIGAVVGAVIVLVAWGLFARRDATV